MTNEEKLAAYEAMQAFVKERYRAAADRMAELKAAGREKSATYRQMMGDKMQYQSMLLLYQMYGLEGADWRDTP